MSFYLFLFHLFFSFCHHCLCGPIWCSGSEYEDFNFGLGFTCLNIVFAVLVRKKCYVGFASREKSVWYCYLVGIVSSAGNPISCPSAQSWVIGNSLPLLPPHAHFCPNTNCSLFRYVAVPAVRSVKSAQYAVFLSRSAYLYMMFRYLTCPSFLKHWKWVHRGGWQPYTEQVLILF